MYNVPAKILYLHRYSTDFQNVWDSSKILRVGIWVERFKRAGILLLQWQGENFAHVQHLKFPIFNLYPVTAKIPYLQRYSTDLRNLRHNSKILRLGNLVENFRRAAILHLQWQAEIVAYRQHLKFSLFQPVHCPSKNPISPKVFNRFSKSLPQLEDFEGGHVGGKFQARRYFTFAMARWELCASYNIWNFPIFNLYPVHSKNSISPNVFHRFSKSLPQLEDFEGGQFGGKFQARSYFTFAMASWNLCLSTTFEIFATFNMYNVPAKILYLQRYSTDFRNLSLSSMILRVGIWVENFRCADIALLQWQGENFPHVKHLKFPSFNLYTVAAKILYLQGHSTNFRNLCLFSTMLRVDIWLASFRCADIVLLQCQGENFPHVQHLKISHFQPVHCPSKNPISPTVFNRFSKSLPQHEDLVGGQLGEKFQGAQIWYFCNCKEKILRMYNNWNFPISICILRQQKSYTCISKGIQPIFEILTSAGRCWEWAFRSKVSGAQILYFYNGKVNTLRIDNIWNFATFNMHHVPAKILYLQRYSTGFRNLCRT